MLVFDVLEPILAPLAARPGDRVCITSDELVVMRRQRGAWQLVRRGPHSHRAVHALVDVALSPLDAWDRETIAALASHATPALRRRAAAR